MWFVQARLIEACSKLIEDKVAAEGTEFYATKQIQCSQGIVEQYKLHIKQTQRDITNLRSSSKERWKLCNSLMLRAGSASSIPPLQDGDGRWFLAAKDKAQTFADELSNKYGLPALRTNVFSTIHEQALASMSGFLPVSYGICYVSYGLCGMIPALGPIYFQRKY